jgi:hypothetical protein
MYTAYVVKLLRTYYHGTMFEPWHHQIWDDSRQVTDGYLSRINRTIAYCHVWHTPAFCPELQLEIFVDKNIGPTKLFSDSILYRKAKYSLYCLSLL